MPRPSPKPYEPQLQHLKVGSHFSYGHTRGDGANGHCVAGHDRHENQHTLTSHHAPPAIISLTHTHTPAAHHRPLYVFGFSRTLCTWLATKSKVRLMCAGHFKLPSKWVKYLNLTRNGSETMVCACVCGGVCLRVYVS